MGARNDNSPAEEIRRSDTALEEERGRGEDLRCWQAEHRAECLRPLSGPISQVTRRLLAAHPDWAAQEQMHLGHVSLEVAACPEAEPVVVECRWAEALQWQGTGAVELSLAGLAGCGVAGTPNVLAGTPVEGLARAAADMPDAGPERLSMVLDTVLMEAFLGWVEQEVAFQTFLASQAPVDFLPSVD